LPGRRAVLGEDRGMSKVLAINGSPRMGKGSTYLVLTALVEGMKDAGADVELFYASRLDVEPCTGEFHCWYEKPGECYIDDDMQDLYPKLMALETVALATPVYVPLPGEMQNVINGLVALVEPVLETRAGRTRARCREDVNIRRFVLLCTSGWWEKENCDTVVRIAQELAENTGAELAGVLLREGGELTADGRAVQEAARKAGYELVKEGAMKPETLELVSRPLISQEGLRQRYDRALE
jgi:hypothetical protein